MKKILLALILLYIGTNPLKAQTTDTAMTPLPQQRIHTFQSTRVILNHSVETTESHALDVRVTHRFGDVAGDFGGSATFWGLDNSADIRVAFEYGINKRLTVALGRNKFDQLIDSHLKYRLLEQTSDNRMPLSITLLGSTGIAVRKDPDVFTDFGSRCSFFIEALIAKKFTDKLSLQISPSYLHRKYLYYPQDEKDLFSLGISGRYKFNKRCALVADYIHTFSSYRKNSTEPNFYDPLALGFEVETGGHVFSVNFTNAAGIVENNFIPNTTSSWKSGAFKLGFNISRIFYFGRD
ncbi:hypothetical protein C3K47_01655 [Solitalea longa]|uniref:DUF5777 domain-containing protein n=1 Tax=Solitalea longa TaxID=2079460 RepID=A0A2S5A9J5_9SPHI|nr:DUF5777 family beta-barrel protein [Solitalea longa]POY39225.1 hypothetical protein C3K47_01655 [Solitalea longa]